MVTLIKHIKGLFGKTTEAESQILPNITFLETKAFYLKKILKFYFLIRHLETQLIWKECVIITEKLVKKFFIKQPTPTHQVLVQKTPIGKVLMAQWKVFHGKNSPNFSLEMTL